MPQSVWIAYRIAWDASLTLGVFVSPHDAKTHLDHIEAVPQVGWIPPQPGRQYWRKEVDGFEYRIEVEPLRTSPGPLVNADLMIDTTFPLRDMDDRLVAD